MNKVQLANGMSLVDMPEAGLCVLCGCPENAVKFLRKAGIIRDVESGGQRFETGPNAILLSETPVQGGRFRNLGEFPVLQMLYRQGMIIPGHPGNTGTRPMIIGMRDQVEAQSRYIYSGNYGLSSTQELEAAGLSPAEAAELFRMKLKFAFGAIKKTEELLDLRVFDGHAIELRGGAFVRRLDCNRYEFLCGGQALEVDLESGSGEAPYSLPRRAIEPSGFSVVHTGEGDGWDDTRPCMASLISCRGAAYLIDAGPDIGASLEALGLGINDLDGVFMTHAHDDHFVGLTALLRTERRLAFLAVPWVRASVEAKLRALSGIGSREFRMYFDVVDLELGRWNDVRGLEVLPLMSPHPVETTFLTFRVREGSGYRSYAHLADLASFAVLDSMVSADPSKPGISAELAARTKEAYLQPADIKKVDAGEGMIHGYAGDFAKDGSGLILLSHGAPAGAMAAPGRTRVAGFGDQDILVPGSGASGGARARAAVGAAAGGPEPWVLERAALLGRGSAFEGLSSRELEELALATSLASLPSGSMLCGEGSASLCVLVKGSAGLSTNGRQFGLLLPGEAFGEEALLVEGCCFFEARSSGPVELCLLPYSAIEEVPLLVWNLRELLEHRLALAKANFDFFWRASYSVGEEPLDAQHRRLFDLIAGLDAAIRSPEACPDSGALIAELAAFAALHFSTEEGYMRKGACPELAAHAREHQDFLRDMEGYSKRDACGDEAALADLDDFLKNWAIRHTLLVDRQYIPYLPSALAAARRARH